MTVIEQSRPVEVRWSLEDQREVLKSGALEWVNAVRGECGAEPLAELPKGVRANSRQCVLARALAGVHDLWGLHYPSEVDRFMVRFDCGEYPELID